MIRRVAFGKAIVAGAAGAFAWELVARALIGLGVPFFDLVYVLGTMIAGRTNTWRWWLIGISLHAAVGAIWAIFYSYFFWSEFDWSPTMQGLVFSIGPAILAGLIMVPQMGFMNELMLHGQLPYPGVFGHRFGWGGPIGIVVGHLVYGITMGEPLQKTRRVQGEKARLVWLTSCLLPALNAATRRLRAGAGAWINSKRLSITATGGVIWSW